MEREKFDDDLSSILIKHEEHTIPVYNRERVWQNTTKASFGRRWYYTVAAVAVLALAIGLLIDRKPAAEIAFLIPLKQENKTKPIDEQAKVIADMPSMTSKENAKQLKNIKLAPALNNMEAEPETGLSSTDQQTIILPVVVKQDVVANINKPQEAQLTENSLSPLKVVFKRGRPAQSANEVVVANTADRLLQFKPRSNSANDTLEMINTNPFKLTFKTN